MFLFINSILMHIVYYLMEVKAHISNAGVCIMHPIVQIILFMFMVHEVRICAKLTICTPWLEHEHNHQSSRPSLRL